MRSQDCTARLCASNASFRLYHIELFISVAIILYEHVLLLCILIEPLQASEVFEVVTNPLSILRYYFRNMFRSEGFANVDFSEINYCVSIFGVSHT